MWPHNWRESNDYKYATTRLTRKQWAWEFLRRNPAYQKDWLKVSKGNKGHKKIIHLSDALFNWGLDYYIDPTCSCVNLKFLSKQMGVFPVHGTVIHDKGIVHNSGTYSYTTLDIPKFNPQHMALGIINIHLPLREQLEKITKSVEKHQRKIYGKLLGKQEKDNSTFSAYIRQLDALADDSSVINDMKSCIYNNDSDAAKKITRNIKRAIILSDSGYRDLL